MLRTFCRAKIHRATITDASLDYVGSMTIPRDLMERLDIQEGEQVTIANVNNGERWTTYAIPGKKKQFSLNGAAARLGCIGDKVIIMTWAQVNEQEARSFKMKVALMDEQNNVVEVLNERP